VPNRNLAGIEQPPRKKDCGLKATAEGRPTLLLNFASSLNLPLNHYIFPATPVDSIVQVDTRAYVVGNDAKPFTQLR